MERNGTVLLPEPVQGTIELRDVVFSYDSNQPFEEVVQEDRSLQME